MTSSAKVILRSKKTKTTDNEYGIVPDIKEIPGDEVCVVYFGGNGTITDKAANGYIKPVELQVINDFLQDIPLYAIKYDFDKNDESGARRLYEYIRQGDNKSIHNHYTRTRYVYINQQNIKHQINDNLISFFKNDELLPVDKLKLEFVKIYIEDDNKETKEKFSGELVKALQKIGYSLRDAKIIRSKIMLNCSVNRLEQLRYIDEIFTKVMLPRISDNGQRLPLDKALKRMRKLNIVTHCFGAYVVQQIEAKTYDKMKELGYSQKEIKQILSQLLVVAHAPAYRPEKIMSHFLGFRTAIDPFDDITPDNWFRRIMKSRINKDNKYMMQNSLSVMEHEWLKKGPIFLGKKGGNLFLITQGFELNDGEGDVVNQKEHNHAGYKRIEKQTDEGYILNLIARNVLKNGIANSLAQNDGDFIPLPQDADLIHWSDEKSKLIRPFEDMAKDGEEFMKEIYDIALENKDTYHQKMPKVIQEKQKD